MIDGNPMTLVQKRLLHLLYVEDYVLKYSFKDKLDGIHIINEEDETDEFHISEFEQALPIDIQNAILEKITLEADMCYGRNVECKEYFKKKYPASWIINIIIDQSICDDLRARFVRLFTFMYVDDPPHRIMKLSRTVKGYESADKYIKDISQSFTNNLDLSDVHKLFDFLSEYMDSFVKQITGVSQIQSFELEIIRCCYYMLRFGLFIYRDNEFKTEDVDKLFSFLCLILDFMTKKGYNKAIHILDDLINRDAVLENVININPVTRVGHDIKYSLFNRNFSQYEDDHTHIRDKIYEDRSIKKFRTKIVVQITLIFHFLNDLRQNFLISNNVELFYQKVYLEYKDKINKKVSKDMVLSMNKTLVSEFLNMIPESKSFYKIVNYTFPSIDMMFDNEEFLNTNQNYIDRQNFHDEFVTLMVLHLN